MSPTLELSFWWRLLGILALEISLVVALAFAAQTLRRSAFWRRSIWQGCFVCLLLLVASDMTGFGRGLAIRLAGKPVPERKFTVRLAPASDRFIPAPFETEFSPLPILVEEKAPVVRSVWWPGILWVAGLGLVVLRVLFARILFITLRWRRAEITDANLWNRVSKLARHFGLRRKIHLVESPKFSGPMTFGVVWSCIGLPKGFAQNFSPVEQDAMLTHELAHVAARDPFWYLLADLASALLWWQPLVWLARRRLHSASELAADEAAAILENGPGTLAKCLVTLGQRLTQSRSFGWLGVDGNGFRSHLGQRVERLLNLGEARKPRLHGWPLYLAKTAGTILCGGIVILTAGWMQNGQAPREKNLASAVQKSWNGSVASMALSAYGAERAVLLAQNEAAKPSAPLESEKPAVRSPAATPRKDREGKSAEDKTIAEPKAKEAKQHAQQNIGKLETDTNYFTRTFKVNPSNIVEALNREFPALARKSEEAKRINPGSENLARVGLPPRGSGLRPPPTNPNSSQVSANILVKEYFRAAGVDFEATPVDTNRFEWPTENALFSGSGGTTSGRAIFFNERSGVLMVRATKEDMEIIASAMEVLIDKSAQGTVVAAPTNAAITTPGRRRIAEKLDQIRLKEIKFEGSLLPETLKSLRDESKRLDPEHRGVNIFFSPHAGVEVPGWTANNSRGPFWLPSAKPFDLSRVKVNLTPALTDVRLAEVLDAIVLAADQPIQYAIEDYAVVFAPKNNNPLYTRTYKVDSEIFLKRLEVVPFAKINAGHAVLSADHENLPEDVNRTNKLAGVISRLKDYFQKAGADLGELGKENGKAIFYSERGGLMVRATLKDLEVIESAIETLNHNPPQITLESRFVEVDRAAAETLDWAELARVVSGIVSTNAAPEMAQFDGFTSFTNAFSGRVLSNSVSQSFTTVLTDAQSKRLFEELKKKAGTDSLAAPKVTTLSGRQAQVSITDIVKIQPESGRPEISVHAGPVLDVIPKVLGDGFTIQTTVWTTLREISPNGPGVLLGKNVSARIRQMSTTANIYDGQTLVLGELANEKSPDNKKRLFIFVTAQIIDSAGNRIHTEDKLSFTTNSVPKQADGK